MELPVEVVAARTETSSPAIDGDGHGGCASR
jgi:hypothetical protein